MGAARPRLFVGVRVQQHILELNELLVAAAHLDVDDFLGRIVIVIGTRLVKTRFLMYSKLQTTCQQSDKKPTGEAARAL